MDIFAVTKCRRMQVVSISRTFRPPDKKYFKAEADTASLAFSACLLASVFTIHFFRFFRPPTIPSACKMSVLYKKSTKEL